MLRTVIQMRIVTTCRIVSASGTVGLIELFGAIRAIEFVSLTGNGNQWDSHKQNGK